MEKQDHLQRICSSCGLTKPLSAFLYISSTRGTTYGTLCSACRGVETARKQNIRLPQDEDSGSTTARLRIGVNEKNFQEWERGRQLEEKKQQVHEEKKKQEQLEQQKQEKEKPSAAEEKRAEELAPPSLDKEPLSAPEKPPVAEAAIPRAETDPEALRKQKIEKERKEQKLAETLINIDAQQTTVARNISDVHRSFLEFLGESAAAGGSMIRARRARLQQMFAGEKPTETVKGPDIAGPGKKK